MVGATFTLLSVKKRIEVYTKIQAFFFFFFKL